MKQQLINYTKKLISFRSTNDQPDQLQLCAEWIRDELEKNITNPNVRIELVYNDHIPSVLAVLGEWKRPSVLLNGHFDVVPGKDSQFLADLKGDKIYGRGAADMKASVASLMLGFIETVNTLPHSSIGIMLTGDEEMGGEKGVKWLVDEGWEADLLVNFDGGYGETISNAEKGIIRAEFSYNGKPGASNRPWDGESAFDPLVNVHTVLTEMFPDTKKATAEDNWYSTFTVREFTAIAGKNENIHTAKYVISIYFTEDTSAEEILAAIQSRIPSSVQIEVPLIAPRVYIEPDQEEIVHFSNCFAKHLGFTPSIKGENGSSDARFFVDQNIPMIITKPKSGNPERDGEWVSISSTEKLTLALIDFLSEKFTK